MAQVVSVEAIQKGSIVMVRWGPSLDWRFRSDSGVPRVKVPPGMGSILKVAPLDGMVSV